MSVNRVCKFLAAAALAIASVPAIGWARPRASVPTTVTFTPTAMGAPIDIKPVAAKVRHKKTSRHHKVTARRHAVRKHRRTVARRTAHRKLRAQSRRTSHQRRHRAARVERRA